VTVPKTSDKEKKASETPVSAAPPQLSEKKQKPQELTVTSGQQLEGIDEVSKLDKVAREKHSTSVREEGLDQVKLHQD
jgi:hypothetical protein